MKKFYLKNETKIEIKKRIKDAIRFLNKTGVKKNQKKPTLNSLPYYIMLGPQSSGKTTLLTKSELKFILSKKSKEAEKIQPTQNYNWWATEHAVIIDTPGKYFSVKNKKNNMQKYFLRLVKKYNDSVLPAGILLTVDLHVFLHQSKTSKQIFFNSIHEQLSTIAKIFRANIPTYLIFNKSDLITGFREYFDDLSREERQQAWGNLIKTRKITEKSFADNFNGTFNEMIRRLNDQLIWHLQHEHNQDKRALINEFPTKMAQLKKPINNLLNNAFRKLGEEFCPAGIFFVSATQEKISSCYEDDDAISSTCHSLINIQPPSNKAYFVHDLFCNHLFAEKIPIAKKRNLFSRNNLARLFLYPMLIILIGFFSYVCWDKYHHQMEIIEQAQQLIINNHSSDNKKLNTLSTLQQINSALSNSHTWFDLIPNQTSRELQLKISELYKKRLNSMLSPKISFILKRNIRNTKLSPITLYNNLKSYLMLGADGDTEKYDAAYLENSLYAILSNGKTKTNQDVLPYLSDWLAQGSLNIKLNKPLVSSARKRLLQLNPVDLAFTILSNETTNNNLLSLNLNDNSHAAYVFTFANDDNTIQSMYTAQNFAEIYPNLIGKAATEAIQGNWVLGNTHSQSNIDTVTQQLADKYLLNYANSWLHFIDNIKMVHFTDLNNLVAAVQLLGDDNSPLLALAKLIQSNIVPQVAAISPTLKNFATLANDISPQDSSKNAIIALKNLATYLQPINSANTDKIAFSMTSIRMLNNGAKENDPIEQLLEISQNYPEPLKGWLYDLGTNAWHLMLAASGNYINAAWQKNILPQYDAQIANHFPFDNTCSNDVSLTSFSYFFAPDGLLTKFFKKHLSPFVDSSQMPWKLKNLDGDSLPIYDTTLTALQKAFQIQYTYFRRSDQSLYVPFAIQPLALNNNTTAVTFALGSQQTTYQNNMQYSADQFIWPDNINSNIAKITFTDQNGKQTSIVEHGPWAWFKLLQQQKMQLTKDKYYNITFNQNDSSVDMAFTTPQRHNPFSLKLFRAFKLPSDL